MTKMHRLAELGQAVWLDYIRRSFITSGELKDLVAKGLRGVTSNPSIFEKAIAGSNDYDRDLHRLVEAGKSVEEIYEALALDDIKQAADILRPVYDRSEYLDGYVSLEVSPELAKDTQGTIVDARRLFGLLARPNVMIKVPATPQGIPAIRTLIGEGINVNVTLMFSVAQYDAVTEAYLAGLEKLAADGGDVSRVASVASFFVSRVDAQVDQQLEALGESALVGKIAIANAKVAYARFLELMNSKRWGALAARGARPQRLLWASTSTKNPTFPDTLYVDTLIGPHTVNTVPPGTLTAFQDHGEASETLPQHLDVAQRQIEHLAELGINLHTITDRLLEDGVTSFSKSFTTLLASIAEKKDKLLAGWLHQEADLTSYKDVVDRALGEIARDHIISRIWAHDHTVWSEDPTEISNRLGWLRIAEKMNVQADRLSDLKVSLHEAGYTHALLLGMGGSSLAPEVFRKTFGVADQGLDVAVLDSTDPGAVSAFDHTLDLSRTVFLVATKSGGTVETLSFFKYFYNRMVGEVGEAAAGAHFIAITDPGSKLADLAKKYDFRATFLNDPNIGGRYSALSYFGLVPAALIGMDLTLLLERALAMASGCESCVDAKDNPGAWLGAIMGELAKAGRDKLTLVTSSQFASFGDWVEQLIAESTGKSGQGILPVVGEDLGDVHSYRNDRLFLHMRLHDDDRFDPQLNALAQAGHPVIRLHLHDTYDLGGQMFLWEMATAVAGHRMGIHPFNQPNVEAAKILAKGMVSAYHSEGRLPTLSASIAEDGIQVYGETAAKLPGEALKLFLESANMGDSGSDRSYVAIQAYLQPTPENFAALQDFRKGLRDKYKLATTLGFGPRFLHSTGQLHKGDAGNGLFIQFTADNAQDVDIPDEAGSPESSMTFGVLKDAQALGDRQALLDGGRRVIRFHLGDKPQLNIKKLAAEIL